MKTPLDRLLDRKLIEARAAIGFERFWSASFAAVMIVAVLALALVTGILAALPDTVRLGVLAAFALAFLWSLRPFLSLRRPTEIELLRRLEIESLLKHRPLSALRDELADKQAGAESSFLWREHLARTAAAIAALRVGSPRSDWLRRDPFALRNAVFLALIAFFILNGDDWRGRIAAGLSAVPASATDVRLDAWITPPNYTGKPPVLLTAAEGPGSLAADGEIVVPEKSALIVRFNNASDPGLRLARPREDGSAGDTIEEPNLAAKQDGAVHETKLTLDRPVVVVASEGGRAIRTWRIALIPDAPPEVSIAGPVEATANAAISVPWQVKDDYGVGALKAALRLSDEQEDGLGISDSGVFLFDAPDFTVQLPKSSVRAAEGKAIQDLTEHPWAGLMVEITLTARDGASQATDSKPVRFKLPEREFTKPLAKALIEQRRKLVMRPDDRTDVLAMLDALTLWPDDILEESGVYLGLRLAQTQLYRATADADVKETIGLLWKIAVSIEDGEASDARRELEAARKALEEALARGDPPEKIAELMQRLREAMDRFLTAMLNEARRNQSAEQSQRSRERQADRSIRTEDLNRMLDAIEKLARSGANEAAQELLSRLEDILSNLQPGMAEMSPDLNPPLAEMLEQLGEILKQQQELMDQTFRMPEPGMEGDMGEMGQEPGMEGQEPGMQGQRGQGGEGLAQQQDRLAQMLQQLMQQLGQNGMQAPAPFGRAQRNMGDASGALRRTERGRALSEQDQAMQELRQGAESMARNLMQQGTGNQGNYGRHGEARGDDRDPLGRPLPSRGEDFGPERNMLPSEAAIEKARRILEFLRSRANDGTMQKLERDYLDRLLRGLY
ncbi:MAG TPA: TIGR02302 family protein [Aestuariivirgaceae bacterium]|nr:TIGR02302 family protein [Aestuariivirgaceae bacterium]